MHFPKRDPSTEGQAYPLVVGIHGATCTAYTYDVTPKYTASTYAEQFNLPFLALNRPNYLDSSGWLVGYSRTASEETNAKFNAPENETYFETEGRWFHDYIFPAIWKEFAYLRNCTSIVTTTHSMSVPGTIIAASHYSAQPEDQRKYKWSGMVLSGFCETPKITCLPSTTVYSPILTASPTNCHWATSQAST
jgi:hypothetical protein